MDAIWSWQRWCNVQALPLVSTRCVYLKTLGSMQLEHYRGQYLHVNFAKSMTANVVCIPIIFACDIVWHENIWRHTYTDADDICHSDGCTRRLNRRLLYCGLRCREKRFHCVFACVRVENYDPR